MCNFTGFIFVVLNTEIFYIDLRNDEWIVTAERTDIINRMKFFSRIRRCRSSSGLVAITSRDQTAEQQHSSLTEGKAQLSRTIIDTTYWKTELDSDWQMSRKSVVTSRQRYTIRDTSALVLETEIVRNFETLKSAVVGISCWRRTVMLQNTSANGFISYS